MKVREALADAARRLSAAPGLAQLDAELLMAAALGVERGEMMLSRLDQPSPPEFEAFVRRRLAGHEPVDYIIGRKGFWTIDLDVGPGALIPRGDSGALIEAALDHFGEAGPRTILDLGTGPGTLLLAALDLWPRARGLGIDISEEALGYARANASRLGLADRAELRRGDWADGLERQFDLVLCNPPYVETSVALIPGVADWEPHLALFGGEDGLAAYRRLAPEIPRLLAPGGVACIEIGASQEQAVRALLAAQGFTLSSHLDLNRVARCLVARLDPE